MIKLIEYDLWLESLTDEETTKQVEKIDDDEKPF